MIINNLNKIRNKRNKNINYKINLLKKENKREINIFVLHKCYPTGNNLFYPNVLLFSECDNCLYRPINEKIMSLKKIKNEDEFIFEKQIVLNKINEPVFYFIYNTDNYYHFLYDSIPQIITYNFLKKEIKNLKLLINFPNPQKNKNYKFFDEFMEILSIKKEDLLFIDKNTPIEHKDNLKILISNKTLFFC